MEHDPQAYQSETAGSIMSSLVPTCTPEATAAEARQLLTDYAWDDVRYIYVLDSDRTLKGMLDIGLLMHSRAKSVSDIMKSVSATIHPDADQEKAVFLAVKNDLDTIPVVDENGRFLGVVTSKAIIDIMHDEHFEDTLLSAGIRHKGGDIVRLASARLLPAITARLPWLLFGAVAGIGLGFISSWFATSLEKSIALAYFIPVVAYIADSVGTQSEAITVRALATLKINYVRYILREIAFGIVLGAILGTIGAFGAWWISQSLAIGIVVGVSLVAASTVATTLASLIPIFFKAIGKDPALGSGPLATALQDVISVLIYFLFATILLGI